MADAGQNVEELREHLTGALEDYLETIFLLVKENKVARVRDIAKARNVRAGSVSPALKRLAALGLVDYARREYVTLTEDGQREARRVLARHDLLTAFFRDVLQMSNEAARKDACAIEHVLTNEGMDRLARFLEYVSVCPEGHKLFMDRFHSCSLVHDDVPPCKHTCPAGFEKKSARREAAFSLTELEPGKSGKVMQVQIRGEVRRRLLDLGLLPNAVVRVVRAGPSGEPVWIELHGSQVALERKEAESVIVTGI
jgi:DtxR family Mn-dependent transcriptional regulator